MDLRVEDAVEADAPALAALRTAVAEHLTWQFGRGHWSSIATEAGVLRGMQGSRVLVARDSDRIVGTLALAARKPWAIDPAFFTTARAPLHLTDMAVDPSVQRTGIGRRLIDEAVAVARRQGSDAIRLDAYDAAAGAGEFYAKCGFRETGRVTYRNTPLIYFEMVLR